MVFFRKIFDKKEEVVYNINNFLFIIYILMVKKNPEIENTPERDEIKKDLDVLQQEVMDDEPEKSSNEKKEKSFTFKPIAVSLWESQIRNWETWNNNITTNIEFAGGWKNLSLYGYTRKDWNKYAKWFNEWIEIFANENLKLWNNIDLNGKQFYWWKWSGKLMLGPKVSKDKQIWNVWIWWSVGAYWSYDIVPWDKDSISGTWSVSVNFSVKQNNGKIWNGNAFFNVNWIKDFDYKKYTTYWEAELETPNFLNPEMAGALCWFLQARYWWAIKEINLMYLWAWIKYKF